MGELSVYGVKPENGDRSRTLHRNLLLPLTAIPVQMPIPVSSTNSHRQRLPTTPCVPGRMPQRHRRKLPVPPCKANALQQPPLEDEEADLEDEEADLVLLPLNPEAKEFSATQLATPGASLEKDRNIGSGTPPPLPVPTYAEIPGPGLEPPEPKVENMQIRTKSESLSRQPRRLIKER